VSALTDLSNNKIGDHTGDGLFPSYSSFPCFDCLFYGLSLWEIYQYSLDLKVLLEILSFFQILLVYHSRTALVSSLRESLEFASWCSVQCKHLAAYQCLTCENT
jgi:hypothetical protein